MGRIRKSPSERHTATMSPAIAGFVQESIAVPLHQLPSKLASFPRQWPLPRGDLYHWIPLLDRFDHILEEFTREYGLKDGPQTQPFERGLLERGDAESGMPYPGDGAQKQELDTLGYSVEGDREMVEAVLDFTRLLLEHCGNRSLYASSGQVNDLLHTTSLSLLRACLKLGLRLAQRYQVARVKNQSPQAHSTLLANHYNFNLDNLHKIALPFPKPSSSNVATATPTPSKGKEKATAVSSFNSSDLVSIAKGTLPTTVQKELTNVTVAYYDQSSVPARPTISRALTDATPATPTPARRTSNLAPSRDRPSTGDRSTSSEDISDTPIKSKELDSSNEQKVFHLPGSRVAEVPTWQLLQESLPNVPKESHYDLLHRTRIAKVFASNDASAQLLLETRLLAVANLAYAVIDAKFTEKLGAADAEEPRRYHLAQQLCDLLQPVADGQSIISLDTETTVLQTLEALVRLKSKCLEVVDALAIAVNHGVLYYELRKAIATLHLPEHADPELELKELEWRVATLNLVDTVSQANPQAKYAERMLAAGVMDIQIEVLSLRTERAGRLHDRIIAFLDTYIHNIGSAFQTLANLKGLEILSDLASHEVSSSLTNVKSGNGIPASFKSKVVDYDIPYYQQATLRSLFKFIVHLFDHNSGVHDRELRNLLDSPPMLSALRTVIGNANIFGSNVWTAAVNTVSNFIHNEPTSFQVVAEAGLAKGILEAITQSPLPDEVPEEVKPELSYDIEGEPLTVVDGETQASAVGGILPVGETIVDIPNAFGAICLNESGMKLFQTSGALDKFFHIFTSPVHVRALEDEGMTAASVGQAFDELSRHHPQLKDQILAAVIKMVKRVRAVSQILAEQTGAGAKLWTASDDGEIEVAGGKKAIAGNLAAQNDDNSRLTAADLGEEAPERAKATPYLSACFKFLEGLCHNSSMCQALSTHGGGEVIIDLATSPSNPYDLVAFSVFNKMALVVKRMCEEKPHLILPSLLARTQAVLKNLRPLIDSLDCKSYMTKFADSKALHSADELSEGTTVLKSLAAAHVMSHMLGRALSPPMHGHRTNPVNMLFVTMNFTDVYVQLVDDLSKLHAACMWEHHALKEQVPEKWKAHTDPRPFSPRRVAADGTVELPSLENRSSGSNGENSARGPPVSEIADSKVELFAFKNARSIRYLLSQAPMGIESFFQWLAQSLTPKRTSDLNTKLHAGLVAEHIVQALISELDSPRLAQVDEALALKYSNPALHATTRLLLRNHSNMEAYNSKEALTLVLNKFYLAGGFDILNRYLEKFNGIITRDDSKDDPIQIAAREGLGAVLGFYSQIVRSRCINDSQQGSAITVRGPENADYFQSSQFLVEIRKIVLDATSILWHSDAIEKVGDTNVRVVIEILKYVLKAEGEEKALKRAEKATRRIATSKPTFHLKNKSGLDAVKSIGHEEDLAKEAIYRCQNQELPAIEYATLRSKYGAARFAIPESEPKGQDPSPLQRQSSVEMRDAGDNGAPAVGSGAASSSQEVPSSDADMSDDDNPGSLGALPNDLADSDLAAMTDQSQRLSRILGISSAAPLGGEAASAQPSAEDTKTPFITIEDLNESREKIREDLIDRCLEVLSAHSSITFELADLIQAAVAKSGEGANPRAEIGNTLVSSLLSLQGDEESEGVGKKTSAYAHLVALILQDRDFFDSTLDELKDNFESFISFIQIRQEQKAEDAPWIEMLLLIVERVLAEDEQPVQVEWIPPSQEDPLKPLPEIKSTEPVVSDELRATLFDALLELLPKVGKNVSLALSITRVMVILTRRQSLATRLSDQMCMSRMFLMIRQLSGPVGEKLQSSFLLVLRHLIEDEQTVRQIMKTEIKAAFEGHRSSRAMDTTTYVRTLYHLVLRNPKIFVRVTQEMLEIPKFDGNPMRAQTLALKPAPATDPKYDASAQGGSAASAGTQQQADQADTSKSMDAKPPSVESNDGVVAFLLRQLSAYRDVEDPPLIPSKDNATGPANEPSAGPKDVEMADASAGANPTSPEAKKNERPTFKAEEHTKYIYRCFILQCLAEIVACYSRTKVEFINFSRKSESQPATPSKPRSGTLLYLLNIILPIGTLEHRDDIAHKKKIVTSNWATTVLVSLCSQTQEKLHPRLSPANAHSAADDDSELAFVRRFVLEHAIRSFKEATASSDPLDQRYSRMMALADLFDRMLNAKPDRNSPVNATNADKSQQQLGRLMYERNLIAALTSAIAEIDLNFPNAKRAVKHILAPLKTLTDLAVILSQRAELSPNTPGTTTEEDDAASDTSASEADSEGREQTPDLFRNSALGIYNAEDDEESDDEDDDDDDDMEEYEYDEEGMDFEEEPQGGDPGDVVSDEDEEGEGMEGMDDMGEIEGMPGDVDMEVEIIDDDEDDDDDDEEDDDEDDDDDNQDGFDDFGEVTGDNENTSLGDDMEEADWEDEVEGYEEGDDDEPPHHHGGPLDHIAQVLDVHGDEQDGGGIIHVDMTGGGDEDYYEEGMPPPEGEDEEDEEDEMEFGDELGYQPENEDEDMDDMGWEWDAPPPMPGHRHRHLLMDPLIDGGMRGSPYRYHRGTGNGRGEDEGTNPLLQRDRGAGFEADRDAGGLPQPVFRGPRGGNQALFGDLVAAMNRGDGGIERINLHMDPGTMMGRLGGMGFPPIFAINEGGRGGGAGLLNLDPRRPWREQLYGPPRDLRVPTSDEAQAVDFRPMLTTVRWQEEARMLFGGKHHEKATRIIHMLYRLLVPPAMEVKRVRDNERKAAEEKARAEKEEADRIAREEREKKEREEREAKEAKEAEEAEEAAAKAKAETEAAEQAGASAGTQPTSMEGVEETQSAPTAETAAEEAPPAERVTIIIRGRELDITNLGIDRDYIEALPEELREDVIMGQFAQQRAEERASASQSGAAPSEISREFLDALPPEIQRELLASEARDRRQREQQETRRQQRAQAGATTQPAAAQDMDQADFLATLDPTLRQTVLMEQDENLLSLLPEEFQREARELIGDRPRRSRHGPGILGEGGPRIVNINGEGGRAPRPDIQAERQRIRPVVQMLDKPGVATLLRLMFVSLHHRAKNSLHGILADVCKNTQNRAEVISILLSILQDGTVDLGAVERSFAQLSLRAKQQSGLKTPQPLKRSFTGQLVTPAAELSPLNIVQQCLGTLSALSHDNPKIQTFFLSEHETVTSQKAKTSKKGKGKESKASKYPLNALLTLLDRKLITENTGVMETLAALLSRVTQPLILLLKKAKAAEMEAKAKADAATAEGEGKQNDNAAPASTSEDVPMREANLQTAASAGQASNGLQNESEQKDDSKNEHSTETQPEAKKKRELEPPEVPEENIRLVINILACRECPSKTFSDTLDIIKHLTAIPGAKEIFGKELIRQAQNLAQGIVVDLDDLSKQIDTAKSGVDLQGMALAKFSSSSSQQRRLLQVLIALDHLFDPNRVQSLQHTAGGDVDPKLKEDILTTLSESTTFEKLWKNLSSCLIAIRRRGNMVNVATILLPLIESLFVVCRNSALKEVTPGDASKEVTIGSPPPEGRMEGLFFTFTEDHRKILNELIRNNPKLMNGNLSILAKNSKMLEFDNKRNYFSRKLHTKTDRAAPHHSLTLNVRRDQVFMDSYKALYYKSGEEIKNGKLNIRFNGEEGIDAGGVSREWFAVMSRQMFNPDYALFNPVASDRTTFHPNRLSGINDQHISFFKFIGRVIGKALYEGRVLDCHFSRAVYRRILGKSVSLKDMETLDLDYYRSLVWILENDITDVTFETFSVDIDTFGATETVDLVPNGRNIPVTEENKQEYVRLVVEHRLVKSVEAQLNAFLGGFHDIIPQNLVSIFNEQEIELLISGLPDIDIDDWKNNTEYHNYQATSPQIQWLWRAIKSFDPEERAKLLQFVTGTSKVPLNGFKELEGMNGFAKFNIHRDYSSKEKLPTSHTCFNQLDLPEYESYEHLRQQLTTAITAGNEYFGFA